MKKIYSIADYKDRFESKHDSDPVRSGMDKKLLKKYFKNYGYELEFLQFGDINFRQMDFEDEIVLFTSSEDPGYHYKDYIEDIILGLKLQGAKLIPDYKYLRANNNKIFMEILRDLSNSKDFKRLKSINIGVYEDLKKKKDYIKGWDKYVVKPSRGAMSKGVEMAKDMDELRKIVKKKSRTFYPYEELKDTARKYYFDGYQKESKHRNKLIIQEFIPNLENDWKVLVYWDKIYVLTRYTRKNDFRASGSGNFVFEKDLPSGLLDFSYQIFRELDVPRLSIDVFYDENNFYIGEFQAIYFGTTTLVESPFYYLKCDEGFKRIEEESNLEKVYAESIIKYVESKNF